MGPSPKRVLESYAWLTGGPPPLAANCGQLGYQQSRYSYETEAQLRGVAERFARRPKSRRTGYIWTSIYQKNNRTVYGGPPIGFPHFVPMLADLKKEKLSRCRHHRSSYRPDLPDAGLRSLRHTPASAGGHFVKNPDGSNFVGKVWPWALCVSQTLPQQSTRQWWGTLYETFCFPTAFPASGTI